MTIVKSEEGVNEAQGLVNNVVSRLVVLAAVAAGMAEANAAGITPAQERLDAVADELEAMRDTLAPVATAGVPAAPVEQVVVPPIAPADDQGDNARGAVVSEVTGEGSGDNLPPQTPAEQVEVPGGEPGPSLQLPPDHTV